MDWTASEIACWTSLVLGAGLFVFFVGCLWQNWRKRRASRFDRLREARATARQAVALIGIVPDAAMVLDAMGRVLLANVAAERLFDRATNVAGERDLAKLFPSPALTNLVAAACRRGATPIETCEIELPAGEVESRWFQATVRAWLDPESETGQAVVVVLRDESKKKAAQRRSAELVSGISHEMKTPLAGIKAYVELLVDGDAEDRATQQEFLSVINSQADRLLKLVDNMVTMAEVEAATAGAGRRICSLDDLLQEAAEAVHPSARAKQIVLVTDFDPRNLSVYVAGNLLVKAAVQLLSNAVKYTPAGGTVVLRSRTDGDRVRFEVEDNGVGLSEEDCGKVFEKFYRVARHKDMASGTGLGLPLARHIVERLHDGSLSVESQIGRGSVFAAEFPSAAAVQEMPASEGIVGGQKSLALR